MTDQELAHIQADITMDYKLSNKTVLDLIEYALQLRDENNRLETDLAMTADELDDAYYDLDQANERANIAEQLLEGSGT
jgi:hypothetical protein